MTDDPLYEWVKRLQNDPSLRVGEPFITCPICKCTSYNPADIREGYCGNCRAWTSEPQERSDE